MEWNVIFYITQIQLLILKIIELPYAGYEKTLYICNVFASQTNHIMKGDDNMGLKNVLEKVNAKKIVKVGGFLVVGVMAVIEAVGKDKDAETLKDLTKRVSELEGKES